MSAVGNGVRPQQRHTAAHANHQPDEHESENCHRGRRNPTWPSPMTGHNDTQQGINHPGHAAEYRRPLPPILAEVTGHRANHIQAQKVDTPKPVLNSLPKLPQPEAIEHDV